MSSRIPAFPRKLWSRFGETVAELVDVNKLTQMNFETKAGPRPRISEDGHGHGPRHPRDPGQARRPPAQHAHPGGAGRRKRWRIAKGNPGNLRTDRQSPRYAHDAWSSRTWLQSYAPDALRAYPCRGAPRSRQPQRDRREDRAVADSLPRARWSGRRGAGSRKHLYSIYKKMRGKRKAFHEIMDVYALPHRGGQGRYLLPRARRGAQPA